jgi:hypothetical protein
MLFRFDSPGASCTRTIEREVKNREFYIIAVSVASKTVNNGVVTGLPKRIPYSTEQGIILAEQAIFTREQGILSARIEITVG